MEKSCLYCHDSPEQAPKDLVSYYGPERSFHRKVGESPHVLSIRVPLSSAFKEANRFSLKLSGLLLLSLLILFGFQFWINRRIFLKPLNMIYEKAVLISTDSKHLGEEIPLPSGRELNVLTNSFNKMSVSLRQHTDQLEDLINERTAELTNANEHLQSQKNMFQSILGAMTSALTIRDLDYNVIYQNDVVTDVFGNCIGEKCYRTFEGNDKICDGCPVELAFKDGKSHISARRVEMPSGEIAFWENVANPIIDTGGKIISCLEISKNITDRKQAEEELRKYQEIVNKMNDGIVIINPQGTLLEINDYFTRMTGWTTEDLVGTKTPFKFWRKKDVPRIMETFSDLQDKDQTVNAFEQILQKKDGGEVSNLVNSTILYDNSKQKAFFGIFRDITELKKTEDQIKASLKEKETFIREVYHRTKNNMQVITAMLHLRTRNIEDDNVIQIFKEMEDRIKVMALVHEKLYQTKDLSRIDLKDYFNDLLILVKRSHKDLTGEIRIKTDMDTVSVTIDSAIPCGLILNELISNAFKHAFPGDRKGEIKVGLKSKDDGGIEIRVSDDGVGMPDGFNYREAGSMGLRTVISLTEHQLQGNLDLITGKGAEFRMRFKETGYKERV